MPWSVFQSGTRRIRGELFYPRTIHPSAGWQRCVSVVKDRNEKNITNDSRLPQDHAPQRATRSISFIMVLWLEGTEDTAAPQWRWRVIDAKTNKQVYFSNLADVLAYVSEQSGVSPPC